MLKVQEFELTEGKGWKSIINQCVSLVFPMACAVCRAPVPREAGLCDICSSKVRYLSSPLCVRCGTLFSFSGGGDHICGGCIRNPPPFSMTRSVCCYSPPVSNLLQRLKYHADRTSLSALDQIAIYFDFTPFSTADLIVPVPLFPKRLRQRGLNQSLLLARLFFSSQKGAIDPEVLARTRDTVSQTSLDGRMRRRNLRSAFAVTQKKHLKGKRVCLVDDVFTTGTTLRECAQVLLLSGAKEVQAVTMARVMENTHGEGLPGGVGGSPSLK